MNHLCEQTNERMSKNVTSAFLLHYLKAGKGDPCAGQLMENIRLFMTLKVPKVSEEVGNMGLADPIGSKMPLYREIILFY